MRRPQRCPRSNPAKLNTYTVEWRAADDGAEGQWVELDTVSSIPRANELVLGAEALKPLRQGDLIRARGPKGLVALGVMTDREGVVLAPKKPRGLGGAAVDWLTAWEGDDPRITAASMILACGHVDRRRVVLMAVDVARAVVKYEEPAQSIRPRDAIYAAERWVTGDATPAEVRERMRNVSYGYARPNDQVGLVAMTAGCAARAAVAPGEYFGDAAYLQIPIDEAAIARPGLEAGSYAVFQAGQAISYARQVDPALAPQQVAIVRRLIPLSVLLLALLGIQAPFRYVRQNPARGRRRRRA